MNTEQIDDLIKKLIKEKTRWEAITTLREINNPDLAEHLIPYLSQSEWVIRWLIAEILGQLKNPIALPHLVKLLSDKDFHVRKNAYKAILSFGNSSLNYLLPYFSSTDPEIRKAISALILELGPNAIEALEQNIIMTDWIIANRIIETIWRIGGSKAEDALINSLFITTVQKSIIIFLGNLKSKKAIPHLLSLFHIYSLRGLIISSLGQIGKKTAYPLLIKELFSSSSNLASQAEEVILKIGTEILPFLVAALEKSYPNKTKIILLIQQIGPQKVSRELHALAGKNAEIRELTSDLRKLFPYLLQTQMIIPKKKLMPSKINFKLKSKIKSFIQIFNTKNNPFHKKNTYT